MLQFTFTFSHRTFVLKSIEKSYDVTQLNDERMPGKWWAVMHHPMGGSLSGKNFPKKFRELANQH